MLRTRFVSSLRRGVALLVVLALLTLFAVVGVSFVLYANAAARSAQLHREAEASEQPDMDPELLFSFFLGQFLYDVPDDETGVYSALRGQGLARNMYGGNGGPTAPSLAQPAANVWAFNGVGRLHVPSPFGDYVPGLAVDDAQLINYTFYPDDPQLPASQRFLRDPERLGWRPADLTASRGPYTGGSNAPYTYPDLNTSFLAAVRGDGTVLVPSFHRPWAAHVRDSGLAPDAGEFYHRDTGQVNSLWTATATPPPWYKYTALRPLPALNPDFPPPEDGGGDVKNLIGGPGTFRRLNGTTVEYWNNDSFWMDVDFPVMTAADGRKYKPLFAALITDLDNRINVNVHGNISGDKFQHRSNQGWGPWEVNLGKVLGSDSSSHLPSEWTRLFRGGLAMPAPSWWDGRYGSIDRQPASHFPGNVVPPTFQPHFYGQVDLDGRDEAAGGVASGRWHLPGPGSGDDVRRWYPTFDHGYGNNSTAERANHPLLFDYFSPQIVRWPQNYNRTFQLSNMEALLRYGDTNSPALTSDLFRLCPANFSNASARRLVTTHSFDIDRPGVSPWVYFPSRTGAYTVPATEDPDQPAVPQGVPIPFRPISPDRDFRPFDARLNSGEFNGIDWRSLSAALARVNLNRPLPPYPHQGSGIRPPFGPPLTVDSNGQVMLDVAFNVDAPDGPIWKQFVLAQEARQQLANDIYRRLLVVTGVAPILPEQNPQEPPPEFLRPRRWLAQLAVNIVDFIDEDDISTPFCFYTAEDYQHLAVRPVIPPHSGRVALDRRPDRMDSTGEIQWPLYWVFGTEFPRVVVNEALAEMRRNQPDEAYRDTVRVFVELHDTFPRSLPAGVRRPDSFPVPLRMTARDNRAYTPFRVLIGTKSPVELQQGRWAAILPGVENDNVLGNPDLGSRAHRERTVLRATTTDADFLGPLPTIGGGAQVTWPGSAPYRAIHSPYVPAHGLHTIEESQGFLLLGPPPAGPPFVTYDPFEGTANSNSAGIPRPTPVLRTRSLQYRRTFSVASSDIPDERTQGVTVMLRRLANPYLPFDGQRAITVGLGTAPNITYNPYLTVDYLEDIPVQPVEVSAQPTISSQGKLQPFAAHNSQLQPQIAWSNAHLRYSFGMENVPAPPNGRYDWLTHLDRPLISPLELLHVSGYQPYQLTQRFMTLDGDSQVRRFGHLAPWLDEGGAPGAPSHRLYRLFEFLETGPLAWGVAAGGRIPGKININTVWDPEILRALSDPQPSNHFQEADVNNLFDLLYDQRPIPSVNSLRRTQGHIPGGNDRPFWSLAVGTYPPGDRQFPTGGGIHDSLLHLQTASAGIHHPYQETELLTKIFNHLTTRSNVFAIWLTVGFFEVQDTDPDTGKPLRPVRLGAELGRAENRHVRHRMFAIVDRTNLSIASCVASLVQTVVPPPPPSHPVPLSPLSVSVSGLSGTTRLPVTGPGIPWTIQTGSSLVVDTGANQETVAVLAVNPQINPPTIRAVFTKPHAAGTPIALADTPGAAPIFLKPVSVAGLDSLLPHVLTVQVGVNLQRSNVTTLAGDYDGIPWTIRPGAKLILDVGPNQEAVTVQGTPFTIDPVMSTGSFQVVVAKAHAPDFLITNTLLGNPGPQRRFNPRDPAFAAIVRYISIIQ